MRNLDEMTIEQKDQILRFLWARMPMETRGELMKSLPQAYNRAVGREIVKVRLYTIDGE